MRFTKMEGTGNDYIYINGFEEQVEDPAALSIRMSRYHVGCGSDGLILILPSERADFWMRMFNNDGSECEMCGNGIRCVAKYCYERGLTTKKEFSIESGGQIKRVFCNLQGEVVKSVRVDMGEPVLDGLSIPSTVAGNPVIGHPLTAEGKVWPVTLVNVGNPHAVTYVEGLEKPPVTTVGPILECDPVFPNKVNVEFVSVKDRQHIAMWVWERGTGETMACGTGACASVVASAINDLTGRKVEVTLPGGKLEIDWSEKNNHVYMTGPANFIYDGEWLQD